MTKTEKPGDQVECPNCGGSGIDPARSYTEHPACPACNGKGTITRAKLGGMEEAQQAQPEPEQVPEEAAGDRPV